MRARNIRHITNPSNKNFLELLVSLDVRKKFFPMTVVRHRNKLHREAIDASPLEVFKVRMSEILSNMV